MKYTLMNKNDEVCIVSGTNSGHLTEVSKIINSELIPIGTRKNGEMDLDLFQKWWKNTAIPAERDSIRLGLECLGITDSDTLKMLGLGLSLNNHYWLKPEGSEYDWNKINYYENSFSAAVGEALFNHKAVRENKNIFSPDSSLNGVLKKKWIIDNDGNRLLVKGGTSAQSTEPFNEKLASDIANLYGISYTLYKVGLADKKFVSFCPCFTDINWEFVPAMDLITEYPAAYGEKPYQHYLGILESLHVPDARKELDAMLCLDYLIANVDRHYNNFGVLYNRKEQVFRTVPLFDSGTSMYKDIAEQFIDPDEDINMRPFSEYGPFVKASAQMANVKLFPDADVDKLQDIFEQYGTMLIEQKIVPESRAEKLKEALIVREQNLLRLQIEKNRDIIASEKIAYDLSLIYGDEES